MATTNTIDSELKVDVVLLDRVMRAFKRRILPVLKFANVVRDVPLQGTNVINVPYYALDTGASTDFSSNYAFSGSTATSYKGVTVNKRKYQPLSWTSDERSRQPALDTVQLLTLKGEKLADDVLADIFSPATAANFGAAFDTVAAAAMTTATLHKARRICSEANWPKSGRVFCLDSGHDEYLMQDPSLGGANYLAAGAIREGTVPQIAGFDYMQVPNLPDNSEKLVGFAAWPSALLVAFSPITPTADVMRNLTEYRTITDPETGLTLEYRRWGNPDYDESREVIEVNYGYAAGETAALKRLCEP